MDDLQPPSHRKILIIRFSSIGDIVLTTPVVRAVRQQLPGVELHFLTKSQYGYLLTPNPYIDKIHEFKGNIKETIHELKKEDFDFIIDLQKNVRSRRITAALRRPHQSFAKLNVKKWIMVNFKANLLPDIHIVDRYFEAARALGIHNDGQGLDFVIPAEKEFDTMDLPAVFEDGYITVSVGAQHATKRIPYQKIVDIGRGLLKPVMLLGGKDVEQIGEEIVHELGERAYNGCGKFNLYESASLIRQSDGLITGDTGLMHIAAALHKPIASLWGNTIPEFGMYPYLPGERNLFRLFEVNDLWCRPCSKLGYKKCPLKHFKCMCKIPAPEVAEWINRFNPN